MFKDTFGVIDIGNTTDIENSNPYVLKNGFIINNNSKLQNVISKQALNLKEYCCKQHIINPLI